MRPVEEFFFFKRHGVVRWSKDTREQLTEPSGAASVTSRISLHIFELGGQEQGCLEVLRHLNRRRSKPYLDTFRAGKLLRESSVSVSQREPRAHPPPIIYPNASILPSSTE